MSIFDQLKGRRRSADCEKNDHGIGKRNRKEISISSFSV
jgi:hypothetical protein